MLSYINGNLKKVSCKESYLAVVTKTFRTLTFPYQQYQSDYIEYKTFCESNQSQHFKDLEIGCSFISSNNFIFLITSWRDSKFTDKEKSLKRLYYAVMSLSHKLSENAVVYLEESIFKKWQIPKDQFEFIIQELEILRPDIHFVIVTKFKFK